MNTAASVCFLAVLVAADPVVDVVATRLDGDAVSGRLSNWSADGLVVAVGERETAIPQAELLRVAFPSTAVERSPADVLQPPIVVELADGATLPLRQYTAEGGEAAIVPDEQLTRDDTAVRLPMERVWSVQLKLLTGPAADDWAELRELELAADLLVIQKGEAGRLDYLEGAVGDVSQTHVEFRLDGELVPIPRSKVAGVVYYRPLAKVRDDAPCVVRGGAATRLLGERVQWNEGCLQLTSAAGLELSIRPAAIEWIDFSAGKLVYLSDLRPLVQRWTPLFGLPKSATTARMMGEPRVDRSFFDRQLSLVFPPDAEAPSAGGSSRPRIKTYNKGLALRSRTELVYRVPENFERFTAVAGIDPEVQAQGNVRLVIEADGKLLLDTELSGRDPPLPIELPVAGFRRLKVLVDYGDNWDTGDLVHLCDAKFTK